MRAHLSCNERLAERLRELIGDPPARPRPLREGDLTTWRALLDDAEQAARTHHQALLTLLKSG